MANATSAFFGSLAERGHDERLQKASGTVRFDLDDGKATEHWLVRITKGKTAVSREEADADCIVQTDKAIFDRLATGDANAMAALLRGLLTAQGDMTLLVAFQRLFPQPPNTDEGNRR